MRSFRNPETGVLTAWGYAASNGSDLARDEPDDFNLEPGKWQLAGGKWVSIQPNPNAPILSQIAAIEAQTMVPRVVREALLLMAEDIAEREAAAMTAAGTPVTKEQLLAENVGYQRTVAVDNQIKQLRGQLK